MARKNKILLIFISALLLFLGLLLFSLRQVLSENQMKQMVETFVAREIPGGKGEIGEIHLNFRRTLEIHFEGLALSGRDNLSIKAERVMLSIPYGNFIFRRGRFDVKVTNSEVRYGSEMSVNGFAQTLKLLEEIPSLVGLDGEVNLKLSDPLFEPLSPFFDFYQPRFSRLVVNNIGRNSELAVELIGSLVEASEEKAFKLIGSINPEQKSLSSTLSVDALSFPMAGYSANSVRLNLDYKNNNWNITGLSEDQVEIEVIGGASTHYEVKRLYFPFSNTLLRSFWAGSSMREGLILSGVWSEGKPRERQLEIATSESSLIMDENRYDVKVSGELTDVRQNYRIALSYLSESALVDLNFSELPEQTILRAAKIEIGNMDLSRGKNHPLVQRLNSLAQFWGQETKAEIELTDVKYDDHVLRATAKIGFEDREVALQIPELAAKLEVKEKRRQFAAKLNQFPCQLLGQALGKPFVGGSCSGQINYDANQNQGTFKLQWEPEGMLNNLTKVSPLSLLGGLEQVWNLEGQIAGDEITFSRIRGKKYHFDGTATGSMATRTLILNGAVKMKRQTLGQIHVEISEQGIKNLNEVSP